MQRNCDSKNKMQKKENSISSKQNSNQCEIDRQNGEN